MSGITLNQLPPISNPSDVFFLGTSNDVAGKVSIGQIIENVKKEIGIYNKVLEKCSHCGQWGAVMCACPSCGAPIDPK